MSQPAWVDQPSWVRLVYEPLPPSSMAMPHWRFGFAGSPAMRCGVSKPLIPLFLRCPLSRSFVEKNSSPRWSVCRYAAPGTKKAPVTGSSASILQSPGPATLWLVQVAPASADRMIWFGPPKT